MSTAAISDLVPMAHVADVATSIAFYEKLGFKATNTLRPANEIVWAFLSSSRAQIMLTKSSGPIDAEQQAVLFYLYTDDVRSLRANLLSAGLKPSEITTPPYMQEGEICVMDPDNYCLLIGQADHHR